MGPNMGSVATEILDIGYEAGGPEDGKRVLLLHGWPDDVRGWRGIAPALEEAGFRWAAPWLRGFGPTRFRSTQTPRDGTGVALAKDAFDFADALGWDKFSVVGHDWGGRATYIMAALDSNRLQAAASLAIGYAPRGTFAIPSFAQAKRWWYQWLMTVEGGAEAIRNNPVGFARIQWDTWSPPGWFDDVEFEATARSFRTPDWADVTLNGYRSRWQSEPLDARYERLREIVAGIDHLSTPMLMIQGSLDRCDPPSESEDQQRYFTGRYQRVVLDGIGHFPAREAPAQVAEILIEHLHAPE
jgi:pimeloyl-ACP methyl ester carboxylesterase